MNSRATASPGSTLPVDSRTGSASTPDVPSMGGQATPEPVSDSDDAGAVTGAVVATLLVMAAVAIACIVVHKRRRDARTRSRAERAATGGAESEA